jgi:regulator of protease activity HflC (stomatin/prohibitin superfamily)
VSVSEQSDSLGATSPDFGSRIPIILELLHVLPTPSVRSSRASRLIVMVIVRLVWAVRVDWPRRKVRQYGGTTRCVRQVVVLVIQMILHMGSARRRDLEVVLRSERLESGPFPRVPRSVRWRRSVR